MHQIIVHRGEINAKKVGAIFTGGANNDPVPVVNESVFFRARNQFQAVIHMLNANNIYLKQVVEEIDPLKPRREQIEKFIGIIEGFRAVYENGFLEEIASYIEADIASDYMGQAEQLLGEGIRGQYDHVPAAVLVGAVLEGVLRSLCQRQNPPIEVIDTSKKGNPPKKMSVLIDELKKRGLYNELKAKQLRSWADIRNAAAHGRFDDFTKEDVEQLIAGAKNFLADYL